MKSLILHQYAGSTFSEKVRTLLGYKQASYRMVEIPMIMPRPYVIPLTGGYRKTPVMQLGADIYCDTALICRVIDQMFPERTIFPEQSAASDTALANWLDTFLFRCAVAIAFQPGADPDTSLFKDAAAAAAFAADRADLAKGSSQLQMDLGIAESHFRAFLNDLDMQLHSADFLGGDTPSIVDFSAFHLVWFVQGRGFLREMFSPFIQVLAWFDRMAAFGHGEIEMIEGSQALAEAADAEPQALMETVFVEDLEPGQVVEVMPIDYGFQPVRGELLVAGFDVIAIRRLDPQAGRMVVQFPRIGFQVIPVS